MAREIPGFVIAGPPRTKKNSGRIVTIPNKGARRCPVCNHVAGYPKLLPSEQYGIWLESALEQCLVIKSRLRQQGIQLPVAGLVSIKALIYRAQASGDLCGYLQAIGDMLQAAEIIQDDVQIDSWDGSRRLKDAARPRVEMWITVLEERAVQAGLSLSS